MVTRIKHTSITETAAKSFLTNAPLRKTLNCKLIPGFRLIKLKKNGSWQYRYTSQSGKRKVATIGSFPTMKPQQAAKKAKDWREAGTDPVLEKQKLRQNAIQAENDAETRTLQYYLDNFYLRHMERSWKASNAKANFNRISKQFSNLLDKDLLDINRHDINEWQRSMESRGLTYETIKRDYARLRALINQSIRDEVIDINPLEHHKLLEATARDQDRMQADQKRSERRMLTTDEIRKLLTGLELFGKVKRRERRNSREHGKTYLPDFDSMNFPHWFIPFCHVGLHTGLRPSDIYTLEWSHINFTFKRLTKQPEKTKRRALAAGKKPVEVQLMLNPTLLEVLQKWHSDQGSPEDGLVFCSPVTGRQLDDKAHNKPWSAVKKLSDIPASLTFYSLRHNFISTMLANGEDVFTVAKLSGHKDPKMIIEHYGHLCPDRGIAALDIVSKSLEVSEPSQKTQTL